MLLLLVRASSCSFDIVTVLALVVAVTSLLQLSLLGLAQPQFLSPHGQPLFSIVSSPCRSIAKSTFSGDPSRSAQTPSFYHLCLYYSSASRAHAYCPHVYCPHTSASVS